MSSPSSNSSFRFSFESDGNENANLTEAQNYLFRQFKILQKDLNRDEFPSLSFSFFPSTEEGITQAQRMFCISIQTMKRALQPIQGPNGLSLLVFYSKISPFDPSVLPLLQKRIESLLDCKFLLLSSNIEFEMTNEENIKETISLISSLFSYEKDVQLFVQLLQETMQQSQNSDPSFHFAQILESQILSPILNPFSDSFFSLLEFLNQLLVNHTWNELHQIHLQFPHPLFSYPSLSHFANTLQSLILKLSKCRKDAVVKNNNNNN